MRSTTVQMKISSQCETSVRRNFDCVKLCKTNKCAFKMLALSVLALKLVTNLKHKANNSANTPYVLSSTHISPSVFYQEARKSENPLAQFSLSLVLFLCYHIRFTISTTEMHSCN
jgi:hypothetical protein